MGSNIVQIVEQTYEEKFAMYMKCTKKQLIEMIIRCNEILNNQFGTISYTDNEETITDYYDKKDKERFLGEVP